MGHLKTERVKMYWIIGLLSFYVSVAPSGVVNSASGPEEVLAASTMESPGSEKRTPTASDQPENEADRKITQQIRQAVTKDDSLSTSAHNVTIVTQDGKVTLRGTVKSQSEKQKISDKAKQVSGVKSVDNLINVKE